MTSIWNQGTKAERFHHRSVSNSCYDDPIPKYISPELVMLIAQNAPSELDVFKMSPTNRSRVLTSTWVCDLSGQELSSETKNNVEATSEMDCGVQVILPSSEETKKTVKNQRTGCHSSSDIMMKADHADGGGSEKANKVRRKRSAPTTPELYNSDSRNTNQLIPESSSSPKSRSKRQYGMHSSSKSVDLTSGIKRKSEEDRPLSAPVVDAEMYHFDALKAKPWRHGMGKKQKSTEPKSCEKISSKRNVDLDERKKSELKKYMATKFGQLRKERKLQEARAAAAEVAQKEKQRRLDAECQALLKSQAAEVKSKQKVLSRPPWISTEYVTLAESFRPWSSVSTGDLPPPKVPENQEPVPLDLYTSITGEAVQESAISNKRRFKKKRQSEKLTMTEAKKQLKGSDIPSNVNEMAFCPAPPYHALHPSPDPRTPKKTSILTKARWKSKGRSLKTFNTHKMYQLQLSAKPVRKGAVDLLAYKKIAKISHMPQNGSFSRETRSTRLPKQSRSFSRNGYSNVLQQDDRYAVTVLKEHERNLSARSKIKIPKETYNATAGHTFLQKLDCNPIKHSRVESGQRRGEDIKLKKISLYNMAKVMDPELSNHSNRVENHKTAASVSPISCKVHSEKSGRRVSLSPNELLRDEAAFQALKPESDSLCVEKHSRDRRTEHFAVHRGKGTAGVDADITKDSALAIRRQRMHMLRGLAEQLLKRLDAACAEHFQNTPKTVSERILESHIDTSDDLSKEQLQNVMNTEPAPTFELHLHTADKPFSESVVLHCLDESLTIELKPYHHFKKPDLLYQGDLSEKEQAGVENFNLLGEKVISSKIPSEQNEIYSHCNLRDKDLCVVKIIPLGGSSSSSGSSSPSFCSEQIPDGVKDRLKNGKHGQKLEEENSKKRPKEVWTLPVEEDPYSVINLYTEHWFSKKKKSRVRSELAGIGQCGDENISSAAKVFTPSHERAQKKHKFKSGSASNCNQLEMSESCIRSAEISCTRSKNGIESSAAQGDEQRYLRESAVSTSSTSSHFGKSVDTTVLGPMKEDNSQNDLPPGRLLRKQLEEMLVDMDNRQLPQSPRSFSRGLEKHSRQEQQEKSPSSSDEATPSQMKNDTPNLHPPLTESSQGCEQRTFVDYPSPIMQRHKATIKQDKNSAADERMAMIFCQGHQGDEGPVELCSSRNDSSESSNSEVSTKNSRVQISDVERLDIPDCHSNQRLGNHQFKDSQQHVLRSKCNLSPSDRSTEFLPISCISDEKIIPTKDSIGTPWNTRKSAAAGETQYRCDGEGRDQCAPQKACKDFTTTSNHNQLSTLGSKHRSYDSESSLHSTGTSKNLEEKQLDFSLSLKGEIQPELQQDIDVLRDLQLQSKRNQLEAELQKLDAEIKRTRAKLEANQSGTKIPTRLWNKNVQVDMLVPVSKEKDNSSQQSGTPSHNLDNSRLPHSLQSTNTPSDSPMVKNIAAVSPKAAASPPLCTIERKKASPVNSNSFVSEDIQIEQNTSSSSVARLPHPQGKGFRNHDRSKPPCPDISFIDENLEHSEGKSKFISSHHYTSKVAEEDLMYHRTVSTGYVHIEGSENSTGKVLDKKWSRPSKEMQEESILSTSDSSKDQTSSPRLQNHQAVYIPFPAMGVAPLRNKERICTLSTKAPEANAASKAGEDFNCPLKVIGDGNSSYRLPEVFSVPNSTDSRDDNGSENPCNHWKDGQNASIYTGQQFWRSVPTERKKTGAFTPISGFHNTQSTTSSPVHNLHKVESDEVPASDSENEVRSGLVNQITPEVEKVFERSDLSSSVEMEINMTEGTDSSASSLNPSSRTDVELEMTAERTTEDSVSSSKGASEKNKSTGSCTNVNGLIPQKPEVSHVVAEVSDLSEISSVPCHDFRTRSASQFRMELKSNFSDGKEEDLQGIQDISAKATRISPENLNKAQNQNHTHMVLEAPKTTKRFIDCNGPIRTGDESESESEKSISDEDHNQISTPNQARIIDLDPDMDTTADLRDTAPQDYSDSCSAKECSEALASSKTALFGSSSSNNLVTNDDRPGKTFEPVQELTRMVANSHTDGTDEEAVPVTQENHHSNYGEPINFSSEDVYISKSPKSDLESEDNDDDDFGRRSPGKEVFQSGFDQLDGPKNNECSLTSPVNNVESGNSINKTPEFSLPEGQKLAGYSELQLLGRASQVSKAISGSLVPSSDQTYDQKLVSLPLQAHQGSSCSPSKTLYSWIHAIETSDSSGGNQGSQNEPDEPERSVYLHPSTRSKKITSGIQNQHLSITEDTDPAVHHVENNTDLTQHGVDSILTALSNQDEISSQQSTKPYPVLPALVRETEPILKPLEYTKEGKTESERENNRETCKQKDMPAEVIASEVPKLDCKSSQVPQSVATLDSNSKVSEDVKSRIVVATELSVSNSCQDETSSLLREDTSIIMSSKDQCQKHLQRTMVELDVLFALQGDSPCHTGEKNSPFTNLRTTRAAESPENRDRSSLNLPTHEDNEAARYYDKDGTSSIGSGKSRGLQGAPKDSKLQTSVRWAGKYTTETDRLTDELLETLVKEAVADCAAIPEFQRLSRSTPLSRASGESSTNASRTSTVSVVPRKKTKSRKTKEFKEVLKHFLPIGWRAVNIRHRIGLLLQLELFKHNCPLHPVVLSGGDFLHSSTTQNTSEVIVPIVSSETYVQYYVQKAFELSGLLEEPGPSKWYDAKTPIGQDIYEKAMDILSETGYRPLKLGDRRTQNRLLSDLVNASLIACSAVEYQPHLNFSLPTDSGKVLHFVKSRVVEQVIPASKHDPDVDKLVKKVMEDEQWKKCSDEVRDLVSELTQGVLCNLIDSFVQEMILGKNSLNGSIFSPSAYRNSALVN